MAKNFLVDAPAQAIGGRVLSFATSVDGPAQAIVGLTPSVVVEEP